MINPNVVTCDGMFHARGKVGKYIIVDGRRFAVSYNAATRCYESYVGGRHYSYTCCGRTRAYLSAYIHMALFPNILG
jgi:hypothetical protein